MSVNSVNRTLCTAPMMDLSDRHCRMLWRLLSPNALLYTEMVTTGALVHGKRLDTLDFNEPEHPIALQLGGNDPQELAASTKLGVERGYDEVNLNVGCPSDRVQQGMIGAVLMKHSNIVCDAFKAMQDASGSAPITIKHRIGVDEYDSYDFVRDFVGSLVEAECGVFIVHARKAFLQGLSPKDNREVPPLVYDRVYQLKQDFPDVEIIINGGIKTVKDSEEHLKHVDGVMLGREAYYNPMILPQLEQYIFNTQEVFEDPVDVVKAFLPYIERQVEHSVPVKYAAKHLLGLISSRPGSRKFRRYLSENMHSTPYDTKVITTALSLIDPL